MNCHSFKVLMIPFITNQVLLKKKKLYAHVLVVIVVLFSLSMLSFWKVGVTNLIVDWGPCGERRRWDEGKADRTKRFLHWLTTRRRVRERWSTLPSERNRSASASECDVLKLTPFERNRYTARSPAFAPYCRRIHPCRNSETDQCPPNSTTGNSSSID